MSWFAAENTGSSRRGREGETQGLAVGMGCLCLQHSLYPVPIFYTKTHLSIIGSLSNRVQSPSEWLGHPVEAGEARVARPQLTPTSAEAIRSCSHDLSLSRTGNCQCTGPLSFFSAFLGRPSRSCSWCHLSDRWALPKKGASFTDESAKDTACSLQGHVRRQWNRLARGIWERELPP